MTTAEKIDKLILGTTNGNTAWLKHYKGIGIATVVAAATQDLLTFRRQRPGSWGSRKPEDVYITLTEAGIARKTILVQERDRIAAELAHDVATAMGPCPVCGALAKQATRFGAHWSCTDEDCPAVEMSKALWKALVARIRKLEGTAS